MQVFVMAQGAGQRWEDDIRNGFKSPAPYKWWIPIGEETIISRKPRRFPNAIFIAKPEIFAHPNTKTLEHPGSIIDGVYQTSQWWDAKKRIMIVLGDVIFSWKMIQRIYEPNNKWSLYGRKGGNKFIDHHCGEIFAMNIPPSMQEEVKEKLYKNRGDERSKLWTLYKLCPEIDFIEVEKDWTDDIDSVQCYHAFGKDLVKIAEEEKESQS